MINKKEYDLIIDLSKLLKKFGPDTFLSLADKFSNPEIFNSISNILYITVKNKPNVTAIKKKKKKTIGIQIEELLEKIKELEPDKYNLLTNFYNRFISKSILPNIKEIKAFVVNNKIPIPEIKSRDRAALNLIEYLSKLPSDKINIMTDIKRNPSTINKNEDSDRSLQGWTDIILNNKPVGKT